MKQFLWRIAKWVCRKAPLILSGVSSLGVIATGYFSAKGSPKALEALAEAEEEKGDELTRWEKVKKGIKFYIPAIIIGCVTIASICFTYVIGERQLKALATAGTATAAAFTKYRNGIKNECGEEKEKELYDRYVKKENEMEDEYHFYRPGREEETCWFYEPYSDTYFTSTKMDVKEAFVELNKELVINNVFDLNFYLRQLGIKKRDWTFGQYVIDDEYLNNMKKYCWVDVFAIPCDGPEGHEMETAYRIEPDVNFALVQESSVRGEYAYIPQDPIAFALDNSFTLDRYKHC